jgi:hypothetical protein
VFLRKAGLIECDPAPAVCARLLTIEIFLTMNPDSTMPCFDEPIRPMTLGNMRSLGVRRLFATSNTGGDAAPYTARQSPHPGPLTKVAYRPHINVGENSEILRCGSISNHGSHC